jgi:hypothetical protein
LQGTLAKDASFDFGNLQEFEGVLVKEPVPMLVGEKAVWYLVNPLKHGFDEELAEKHHLHWVSLRGTLISREGRFMIEAIPASVRGLNKGSAKEHPLGAEVSLGEVTLKGEIVDSKCYLGVMNPGNLKPHRACAVNCISGGVPPVLLLRDGRGAASYVLLVGEEGEAINEKIIPLVAAPVAVSGRLEKLGGQLVLYASPEEIVRVGSE